jgi:hypothetical protein
MIRVRPRHLMLIALAACDAPASDAREAYVADTLIRADEAMIRARPVFVEGMFSTMS